MNIKITYYNHLQARDRCDQCLSHDADGHRQSTVESRASRFLSPSLRNPPAQDTGDDCGVDKTPNIHNPSLFNFRRPPQILEVWQVVL